MTRRRHASGGWLHVHGDGDPQVHRRRDGLRSRSRSRPERASSRSYAARSIGNLTNDLSLGYGQASQAVALGQIVAILSPGNIFVEKADGFANIISTDCIRRDIGARWLVRRGRAGSVRSGTTNNSTWGQVKALYR
jgi:hypothetical protein